MSDSERVVGPQHGDSIVGTGRWTLRSGAAKGRILVVEDEEVLRDALEPLLEEEGYEVSVAENGREALSRLHTESLPDIIVLDLKMPVMNGWEFRTIQKDDPKLGRIPVVAVSGDGSAQAAAVSAQAFLANRSTRRISWSPSGASCSKRSVKHRCDFLKPNGSVPSAAWSPTLGIKSPTRSPSSC